MKHKQILLSLFLFWSMGTLRSNDQEGQPGQFRQFMKENNFEITPSGNWRLSDFKKSDERVELMYHHSTSKSMESIFKVEISILPLNKAAFSSKIEEIKKSMKEISGPKYQQIEFAGKYHNATIVIGNPDGIEADIFLTDGKRQVEMVAFMAKSSSFYISELRKFIDSFRLL